MLENYHCHNGTCDDIKYNFLEQGQSDNYRSGLRSLGIFVMSQKILLIKRVESLPTAIKQYFGQISGNCGICNLVILYSSISKNKLIN
jgi:hypothetical protein